MNEMEIDFFEIMGTLKKHFVAIIIVALLCGGVGAIYCFAIVTPVYQSTAQLYVYSLQDNEGGTANTELEVVKVINNDCKELITSQYVINKAIRTGNLNYSYGQVKSMLSVDALTDTRVVSISVTSTNPKEAPRIANAIAETSAKEIANIMNTEKPIITDKAEINNSPIAPQKKKIIGIAFILGLILMSLLVIIREILDNRIKTADDINKYIELSVLGQIPIIEGEQQNTKQIRRERRNKSRNIQQNKEAAIKTAKE